MSVLLVVEHDNHSLSHATLASLTAALALNQPIKAIVIGYECQKVAQAIAYYPIEEVICVDHLVYQHHLAQNCGRVIAKIADQYTHLIAPASTFGKNMMPYVAGLLGIGQISDVSKIISEDTFIRPIYAGNAFATVTSLDKIKVITIRSSLFPPAEKTMKQVSIKNEPIVIEPRQVRFLDKQSTKTERPDLASAKIIVSGGRGLQNAENFKLIEELANQLGAAVGASRAAVDAGFISNDYQVGQTGKVVAPDLYIAIGISGAVQHVAGMKDSKIIVAINKDPDAPIFGVSDYGLVGDLFKILSELKQALALLGYKTNEEEK